jgi:hypothetical protein
MNSENIVAKRVEANELCWTANAYLQGALHLCEAAVESAQSGHHVARDIKVVLHLTFLAIELTFKAGITAMSLECPRTHDLVRLRRLYNQVFPDQTLAIPEVLEQLMPMATLFGDFPEVPVAIQFERFRYHSDHKGRPFPELPAIDVEQLEAELSALSVTASSAMWRIWRVCGY